jgi:hypothetical protein
MSGGRGFFSRILGRNADEDETRIFLPEEIGKRIPRREGPEEEPPHGFTVERAAGIIDGLPPDVPRESAVRIVRGTLIAADIEVEDIEKSTRARESKLSSEIELARSRQEDLRRRTEEVVRSLEEKIRKAREARDVGITEEEENVSRAVRGLEEVRRVRAFFGFPETEEATDPGSDPTEDEMRPLESFDPDRTRVMRRPRSLADTDEPAEGPSTQDASYGMTDER